VLSSIAHDDEKPVIAQNTQKITQALKLYTSSCQMMAIVIGRRFLGKRLRSGQWKTDQGEGLINSLKNV